MFYNSLFRSLGWHYVDKETSQALFFPKLKIKNAKDMNAQKGYGPTVSHYYWFKYPHHLEYHETLKVTVYCSFDFGNFPFDSHLCRFNFGSSGNADYNLILMPSIILHHDESTKLGDVNGKYFISHNFERSYKKLN